MPVEPTDPADLIDNIANGRITGPADVLADLVRNAVANPELPGRWLLRRRGVGLA